MSYQDSTKHLHIEFYTDEVEDKKATRENGRPIHKTVEMVRIRFVGDPKKELCVPAHDPAGRDNNNDNKTYTWAEKYSQHYEAWKKFRDDNVTSGTPLSALPGLTSSQVADLKAMNVYTVEQLSTLEGAPLQKLAGFGRSARDTARAFLKSAEASVHTARTSELESELAALKEQLAKLTAGKVDEAAPEPAETTVTAEDLMKVDSANFSTWDMEDLKRFIFERTGQKFPANVKKPALVAAAEAAFKLEAA